jgi:hypothetical protein
MNIEGIHEPVNLGNPHKFTIRELAEHVAELCGTTVNLRYCPLPVDDPVHRCPDITRAQQLLNWNPTVELREGLVRTIEDFESRLSNPQGSRVRATFSRRQLEYSNGNQAKAGAAAHNGSGKAEKSDAELARPFFQRAELAGLSEEAAADFEGLWIR